MNFPVLWTFQHMPPPLLYFRNHVFPTTSFFQYRSQDFTFNNSHLVRAYLKYWSRPALTYLKVNVGALRYHNETKNAFVPMYWIYTNLCLQTGGSGDYFTRSINVKGTPFMGTNEKRRLTQGGFNQSAILCSHCSSRNWIPNIAKTKVTHWFQKEDLVQL